MTVRWDKVDVGSSPMRVYTALPEPTARAGIVVAQHASGVDEQMQDVVHRLHRAGYAVVAPELFHRQGPGFEPMQRVNQLRDDEIIADVAASLSLLKDKVPGIKRLGMLGFCMGGRVAFLAATVNRDFDATAVFYGGNIMKPYGDGPAPFERIDGISKPLIGFFGAEDTNPSPADTATISAELSRLGKHHEFHTYQGAGHAFHAFANPQRYRPRAVRASWGELLAFFDEHLEQAQ